MLRRSFLKMLAGAAAAVAVPIALAKDAWAWGMRVRNNNTGAQYETLQEAVDDLPEFINEDVIIEMKPGVHQMPAFKDLSANTGTVHISGQNRVPDMSEFKDPFEWDAHVQKMRERGELSTVVLPEPPIDWKKP